MSLRLSGLDVKSNGLSSRKVRNVMFISNASSVAFVSAIPLLRLTFTRDFTGSPSTAARCPDSSVLRAPCPGGS